MESINLLGSEEVQSAANTIMSAAQEMSRAAGCLDYALLQQRQFMDDWLMRLEDIMKPQEDPDV